MSGKPSRFREARFFVGAGSVAMLLGLWSALTVHDIQARNDDQGLVIDTTVTTAPVEAVPANTQRSVSGSAEQPATTTTTRPAPHTRTRAS